MCIELKIKSKHLSLESKVIRFEERKLIKQINWLNVNDKEPAKYASKYMQTQWKLASLSEHRKTVVRNENRATFLARAYLAGKPYSYTEKGRRQDKEHIFITQIIPRVFEMIRKYGTSEQRRTLTLDNIKDWCII